MVTNLVTNPAPNWGFTKFCAKVVTKISDHKVNHKNVHQIWWQICRRIRKIRALYPFCAYFIINNRVRIGSISGMLAPATGKAGCHAQRKVDLAPPLHVKLTKPAVRSRAKLTADVVFLSDLGKPGVRSMGPLVCPSLLDLIPDICNFFYTGSIFEFQILHRKID